jgi:hypothetical protein
MTTDPLQKHRSCFKAGLADFIKHCMKDKEPLHWGWHLDLVSEHLEAVAEGRARPLRICLSRREMMGRRTP